MSLSHAARFLGLALLAPALPAQSVLWHQIGPEPPSWTNTALYPSWFNAGADVNGDGVGDVVAAAPGGEFPLTQQGRVYVYSGLDGSIIHEIDGPQATALLGEATLLVGDMNGDGLAEIAASVLYKGVWIYSGADGSLLQVIAPPSSVPCSRWLPLAALDANGDGVQDLVLGCPDASPDGSIVPGAAAIVSGADGAPLHVWSGDADGDRLGWSAADAGDQDGDGVHDVIVGAPHFLEEFVPYLGISYARLYSGATGAEIATLVPEKDMDPADYSVHFGYSVAGNGSLDGQGAEELLASIFLTEHPTLVFEGETFRYAFETAQDTAHAVRVLGDVDGDGFDDFAGTNAFVSLANCEVLPGPPAYKSCGKAVIYSGRDGRRLFEFRPEGAAVFGSYAAAPGDLDGDDFPDVVVSDVGWPPQESKHKGRLTAYSLIPEGVSALGHGCGTAGAATPRIGVTGSPVLGTTLELHLSKADAGVPALLALGLSDVAWKGATLPFDLAAAGLPGCAILVSPDVCVPAVTQAAAPAPGRATIALAMPQSPALLGLRFFAQWYAGGPSPAFTRALRFELLQPAP